MGIAGTFLLAKVRRSDDDKGSVNDLQGKKGSNSV